MKMKLYEIAVEGYGEEKYFGLNSGQAKYKAYMCDAFCDMTFIDFLKRTKAKRIPWPDHDGYSWVREKYSHIDIPEVGSPVYIPFKNKHGHLLPAVRLTDSLHVHLEGESRIDRYHPSDVVRV